MGHIALRRFFSSHGYMFIKHWKCQAMEKIKLIFDLIITNTSWKSVMPKQCSNHHCLNSFVCRVKWPICFSVKVSSQWSARKIITLATEHKPSNCTTGSSWDVLLKKGGGGQSQFEKHLNIKLSSNQVQNSEHFNNIQAIINIPFFSKKEILNKSTLFKRGSTKQFCNWKTCGPQIPNRFWI